jgi:hypothetical protein
MSYPLYYAYDGLPAARTGASHATIYPYGPPRAGQDVMLGCRTARMSSVLHQGAAGARSRYEPRYGNKSKRSAARD